MENLMTDDITKSVTLVLLHKSVQSYWKYD